MRKRVGLWAFVVAGIALTVWGLTSWLAPSASCRGVPMQPGDECAYSSRVSTDTELTQTYEQRIEAAREGAPTVVVLGLLTTGFGAWVAIRAQRTEGADED